MSFLEGLFKNLADQQDEVTMKQIYEFYGPLSHWAMLYPRYNPEDLKMTLFLWVLYSFVLLGHIVLFGWSAFLELETFEVSALLLHFEFILVLGTIFLVMYNFKRRRVSANHRSAASDMGSFPGGRIYSENEPMRQKKQIDRETLVMMMLPLSVSITAGAIVTVPYIAKFSQEAEYTKNGVNMNLPIPLYFPFPTHEGVLHWAVILSQLALAVILALVFVTTLLALARFGQRIKYEYRVLGFALRTLFKRSARLYKLDHPGEPISTFDPVYQKYVEQILRCCIIHHNNLREFMENFDTHQVKWPAAISYGIGTGSIGLSLVTLLSALRARDYQSIIIFSMLGIAEVLSMLFLSIVGETITTESKRLRDQLYDIEWYNFDVRNRKTLLNFQVGIIEPYVIRAGGLVDVCLDTFSSIMNSAYSFFNLMNAGLDDL